MITSTLVALIRRSSYLDGDQRRRRDVAARRERQAAIERRSSQSHSAEIGRPHIPGPYLNPTDAVLSTMPPRNRDPARTASASNARNWWGRKPAAVRTSM